MQVDLFNNVKKGETVAIAVSGGSDSMALLYYMNQVADKYGIKIIALNVEHGIRGESSKKDSLFVKSYCEKNNIPLLLYSVDSIKKAKEDKLSVEQSARILRYECFFDAINNKKCDKVATAHHKKDNVESVLFNLFRGTGLKGVSGINQNYDGKIIRPFLTVDKAEIESFVKENSIPFVNDETNFNDDYTRNFIRLNVLPKIKEVFPEVENSVSRFSEIVKEDDDFLEQTATKSVKLTKTKAEIPLPLHPAIFKRAVIIALKSLGIFKDWEKAHVDSIFALSTAENGKSVSLPKNICAIKEYDKIVIFKKTEKLKKNINFAVGKFDFFGNTLIIEDVENKNCDLTLGLFADKDKIPKDSIIRFKKDGDVFNKFGGGTKKLNDYLTDKKIPLRLRSSIPVLAYKNDILIIFGVAVSNKLKVDDSTKNIIKFSYEDTNEKL